MSRLYFKRGVEFTPLIFQKEEFVNKKYAFVDITNYNTCWYNSSEEYSKLDNCLNSIINPTLIKIRRTYNNFINFFGGNCKNDMSFNLLFLIVTKNSNGEKYIIINSNYYNNNQSSLARLKKQMNIIGISSRSKLIEMSETQIYSTYQELFNPTMEDYMPEKQLEVSKQFVEFCTTNGI